MISERAHKILNQVVTLHYHTCGPVGSKLISRTRTVPFSPATIRSIMGRLEQSGHLSQPHTSAGRLPTDLGYRTYVNDIKLKRHFMENDERNTLQQMIQHSAAGPSLLKSVSDYLHQETGLVTFHVPFHHSGLQLKHIHFERLGPDRLLVLWVGQGGHTYQSVLEIDEQLAGEGMVEKIENYMNRAYGGLSLMDIHRRLQLQHGGDGTGYDLVVDRAARITKALTDRESRLDNIQHQGMGRLLDMPEFRDIEQVRKIIDMLEKPTKIQALIHRTLDMRHEWVMFFIGSEMADPDLDNLTIVLAKMSTNQSDLGCVGVVGPKRLPYLRSMQILSVAKDAIAMR